MYVCVCVCIYVYTQYVCIYMYIYVHFFVWCRHGSAWIGLHAPDPDRGYVWSDGSPVSLLVFTSFVFLCSSVFYCIDIYVFSCCIQVNFLHWQEGEPNNHNNDESCAEFRLPLYSSWEETGSWNDANCERYNDWLCQIRAGTDGMKCF